MKVRIDVDCTPEEARTLLGLPDLTPLHAAFTKQMEEQMAAAMKATDPTEMMKAWGPLGVEGLKGLQNLMFGAAMKAAGEASDPKKR